MDPVHVYKLFAETDSTLSMYERRAREGKDLEAALEFNRFLFWGRVVKAHADMSVIAFDAHHLEWRVKELGLTVRAWYSSGQKKPEVAASDIEAINRKLEVIAGQLSAICNGSQSNGKS